MIRLSGSPSHECDGLSVSRRYDKSQFRSLDWERYFVARGTHGVHHQSQRHSTSHQSTRPRLVRQFAEGILATSILGNVAIARIPENGTWFFRGAKTLKGQTPRRSGDSFCGLLAFLQAPVGPTGIQVPETHTLPSERIKHSGMRHARRVMCIGHFIVASQPELRKSH